MSWMFEIIDILDLAIQIERHTEKVYRGAQKSLKFISIYVAEMVGR